MKLRKNGGGKGGGEKSRIFPNLPPVGTRHMVGLVLGGKTEFHLGLSGERKKLIGGNEGGGGRRESQRGGWEPFGSKQRERHS